MSFRALEKDHLQVLAPVEIVSLVREKAARERRSLSSVTTELLCVGLKRKPSEFGIGAKRTRKLKAATTTA